MSAYRKSHGLCSSNVRRSISIVNGANGSPLEEMTSDSELSSSDTSSNHDLDLDNGVPLFLQNDHEAEKRERQRTNELHRQQLAPPQTDGTHSKKQSLGALAESAQLTEHYFSCIKLSKENKINTKNAFNLKLIDYTFDMLQKKDSKMNNFKVANSSLDAIGKIYGARMDNIHLQTIQLANMVGRTQPSVDVENQVGEDGEEKPAVRRKKKTKGSKIVTNLALIDLPQEAKVRSSPDPILIDTCLTLDDGAAAAGARFVLALKMRDDSMQLSLGTTGLPGLILKDASGKKHRPDIKIPFPVIPDITNAIIDPVFSRFSFLSGFGGDGQLKDISSLFSSSSMKSSTVSRPSTAADLNQRFDVNAIPEPIPEEDEDFDHFDDAGVGDNWNETENNPTGRSLGMTSVNSVCDVREMSRHLSVVPQEYSYFDRNFISAWAGPKHWKMLPMSRANPGDTGSKEKRKAKPPISFDFDMCEEEFLVAKGATCLTAATMEQWGSKNHTLPEDFHVEIADLTKFWMHNNWSMADKVKKKVVRTEVTSDYNLNDSQNFFSAPLHVVGSQTHLKLGIRVGKAILEDPGSPLVIHLVRTLAQLQLSNTPKADHESLSELFKLGQKIILEELDQEQVKIMKKFCDKLGKMLPKEYEEGDRDKTTELDASVFTIPPSPRNSSTPYKKRRGGRGKKRK